jgi:polysaccharide pyruvyl transferase WcaK-like protein
MRVSFLGNFRSPNIGNAALVKGAQRLIKEDLNNLKWDFVPISWDKITFGTAKFNQQDIEHITSCDAFYVSGAVTFNNRANHTLGGSRLNLSISQWEKIQIPIILGGLSYRHWGQSIYNNLEALKENLSYLNLRKDCLLGLRNDGTREWLQKITGLQLESAYEVPDPGFFVLPPRDKNIDGYGLYISVNNEDYKERFTNGTQIQDLAKTLAKVCLQFFEITQEDVFFVPHSFEDYAIFLKIFENLPPAFLHMYCKVLPMPAFDGALEVYEKYQTARLQIGMRVHSINPCLGMGVPTIALSSQDRISKFIRDIGMPSALVELHSPFFPDSLLQKVEDFLRYKVITDKSDHYSVISATRARFREFNKTVARLLQS